MSNQLKVMHNVTVIFSGLLFSLILASCSGGEEQDKHRFDHSHDKTIDIKKHLFEHTFAEQCITKEMAKLTNKASRESVAKSCMCLASHLFKDLAAKQSYKLLNDKKQARSLRKKYEEAAKQCL